MKQFVKMEKSTPSLKLFLTLAKVTAKISRHFESSLGEITLTEFMVLHYLRESSERKLRRVDLAKKLGITAQGVTKNLRSMEKEGLIGKDINTLDGRVNYVTLTAKGRLKFLEVLEKAEAVAKGMLPNNFSENIEKTTLFLTKVAATITDVPVR